MKIDVVVADDFPLWRNAVAAAIGSDPAMTVVAEAATGRQALEQVVEHQPDVVILDLHMPGDSGMSVIPAIRERAPKSRLIVLTASLKEEPFLAAMSAGASAYLNKQIEQRQLLQAIITVHGGGSVISPHLADCLVRDYATACKGEPQRILSERESELIRLVALGMTDLEIGSQLFISPRTVQSHLGNIREKLGVRRRAELARWAADHVRI